MENAERPMKSADEEVGLEEGRESKDRRRKPRHEATFYIAPSVAGEDWSELFS